jgi:hypothetical protein
MGMLFFASVLSAQITTRTDAVGKQLNDWFLAGEAAGLRAIRYENRDGAHSLFGVAAYPQLRTWGPGGEEPLSQPVAGPASQVRTEPVFGNCSMAAPADKGGSLPRLYMLSQGGFDFLTAQYLRNNLFFYPEHQDYDAGYLGRGGWGDLYPVNTPCLVISQGSSFSDQPFIQSFFSAAAALPPATQDKLIRSHMLVPVLQSIFRKSNRQVVTDEDYFTGKAHPPVFDGSQIDEARMIQTAHLMTETRVPPAALMEVIEESAGQPGRDYFELDGIKNEVLGSSPVNVARVHRTSWQQRQILVRASRSLDLLRRDLTYRWAILQGDPKLIKIEPSSSGTEARITVAWHPELKTTSGIPSHRVDIGVFASNGFAWSSPAIVSIYMLPNEIRFYDPNGRLEEICYEAGNPDLGLPPLTDLRWLSLARRLTDEKASRGNRLLASGLGKESLTALRTTADSLVKPQEFWRKLSAFPEKKAEADAALSTLQGKLKEQLEKPIAPEGTPLWKVVEQAISKLADLPDLYTSQPETLEALARSSPKPSALEDLAQGRQRLLDFLVLVKRKGEILIPVPLEKLTDAERYQLRHFHLIVLNQVLLPEFLERNGNFAYVDPRLSLPKCWRDLYRYDKDGQIAGWTRITNGRTYDFDSQGRLIPEDKSASPINVRYAPDEKNQRLVFVPRS